MAYVANPPLEPRLLLHALAKNWWLLLLRGICAIVFGATHLRLAGNNAAHAGAPLRRLRAR